jgi:flagellar secretion chaperone FliS
MNAYNMYRQTQAQTAAPGELVVMLYRGAARFVTAAIDAIEHRDIQTAHDNLVRAQAVITELLETLDLRRGGDLARNLADIYVYLLSRLVEANVRKDAHPAHEVACLLHELLPAWESAARQTAAGAAASTLGVARSGSADSRFVTAGR